MNSDATDPPVLIIGYGNTLRGDDGAGCTAARRLARRLSPHLASVLTVHQLLPELADPVSRSKLAIFIDADCRLAPGVVHRRHLIPSPPSAGITAHQQDPERILRLVRDLFGRAPRALLFTIGGSNFAYNRLLSPPVQRALPGLIRDVSDVVTGIAPKVELCHA
jgi:hydrogenase maturation protease